MNKIIEVNDEFAYAVVEPGVKLPNLAIDLTQLTLLFTLGDFHRPLQLLRRTPPEGLAEYRIVRMG